MQCVRFQVYYVPVSSNDSVNKASPKAYSRTEHWLFLRQQSLFFLTVLLLELYSKFDEDEVVKCYLVLHAIQILSKELHNTQSKAILRFT